MSELYTYTGKSMNGDEFSLENLRGKVILIVNTASKCGFTHQYEGLQQLHENYSQKGLEILGFPSNDFLFQEPGSNEEIKNFCTINYGVDFLLFEKVHVRGSKAHPLFQYLSKGADNRKLKGSIKWNFTKFLFNQEGNLIARFSPLTPPKDMEEKIKDLLQE
jgi:glutathione peroxidase